jgi:hypothetical protein
MSIRSTVGAAPVGGVDLAAHLRAPAPARLSRRSAVILAHAALAGVLVCAAVIAVGASATDQILPQSVQPLPGALAGPLGGLGLHLRSGPLILAFAGMFACYVMVVRTAGLLHARVVLACIVALMAIVVLAPPLFSTDLFSYQAYARMWALYGTNPYTHGPQAIMLDPIYPYVGSDWVTTPSAYGPLFTLLSGAFARLSVAAAVLAYKSLAAASCLTCVWMVWRSAALRGAHQVRAVALVAFNPLLALYGVGGSHNDLLMLAVASLGIYLLLAQHPRTGAGAIVIAAAIKINGILALPFVIAERWRERHSAQRRRALLAGTLVGALVALGASVVAFGAGTLDLPHTLLLSQAAGDWHSIPGFLWLLLGLGHVTGGVRIVLDLGALAVFLALLRAVSAGRMHWVEATAWATFAILVSASALLPWYVSWLLPLVAISSERRLWRCALWLSGIVLALQIVGYLPHNELIRAL